MVSPPTERDMLAEQGVESSRTLISVVVCTYNRADLLPKCLQSLAGQTMDPSIFEVIVVDNNSTDSTHEVAARFAEEYPNFSAVSETNEGLSYARNRGWRESHGAYVAYIDDDAIALPNWVAEIKAFIVRHPQILAFGGPYESFSLVPVPLWFPPEYGSWNLGEEERQINIGKEWIIGLNMIFHKQLLLNLGGFNPCLGMSGRKVSYGEETSLLLNLKNINIPVYYVPTIKVLHLVAEYKMSLLWLIYSSYKVGRCSAMTFGVSRSIFSHIYCILACTFTGAYKMLCLKNEPIKRITYISFYPLIIELGAFVEYLSNKVSKKPYKTTT